MCNPAFRGALASKRNNLENTSEKSIQENENAKHDNAGLPLDNALSLATDVHHHRITRENTEKTRSTKH